MRSIYFYKVDNDKIICVKKIHNTINFIDVETDGLNFSHTLKANFSKKNIERFLKLKFKQCNQIKTKK
jgi:hypothetical protein